MRFWVSIVACLITLSVMTTSCGSHRKITNRHVKAGGKKSNRNQANKPSSHDLSNKYAGMMGVSANSLSNDKLYQFIDDWYGTPYRYGGTSTSGVDCSGFVGNLYREVYSKDIPRTTSLIEKQAQRVSKSSLKEGNLVIFDIEGKKSSHIGVYLQNGHFVHASSSKGVIISDLKTPYYEKNFSRGGKL